MTTTEHHARIHRTHVRSWLVAAALAGLHLSASAVNTGNIGRAGITRGAGGTTSLSAPPQPNSGGSTIPVSPTIGGWSAAGNYGFPTGPTSPTIGHTINGEFVVGGSGLKYPFQAKYPVDWKGMAGEAGKVMGTLGCSLVTSGIVTAACMVAVPYIWDWISKAGGRRNPTTGALEQVDRSQCTGSTQCRQYRAFYGTYSTQWVGTAEQACDNNMLGLKQTNPTYTYTRNGAWVPYSDGSGGGSCPFIESRVNPVGSSTGNAPTPTRLVDPVGTPNWLPASMDDIAPYMSNLNPDGRIAGEILSNGGEVPLGVPAVTGPTTLQGPETTKQNADGTKEISRTTYNFSTAGNTITNTSNITTTNNYNASGAVTNTTTTTTNNAGAAPTGESEPPPTQCDKFPESLGCSKLDVPAGTIPKENKTITFAEESSFGGGSCPADRSFTSVTMHRSVKVVDWTTFCANALPIRALVILLATFAAFLIVMPGKEVRT